MFSPNNPHRLRAGLSACLPTIAACAGLLAPCTAQEVAQPTGSLTTETDLVRANTHVPLSWQILIPSIIEGLVTISADGTLVAKQNLTMQIRILGMISNTNNGHGNNVDGVDSSNPGDAPFVDSDPTVDDEMNVWAEMLFWTGSTGWVRAFYGEGITIDPTLVVAETTVQAGDQLEFAARSFAGIWGPFYSTAVTTANVAVLQNGDPIPASSLMQIEGPKEYLAPYVTADMHAQIGPRDLLYMVETIETNTTHDNFDRQDLAFLVSFGTPTP